MIGTTDSGSTSTMLVVLSDVESVTFTGVFGSGFDTTIANGECCASSAHTSRLWHVAPSGHRPPGSQMPYTALPSQHTSSVSTFGAPGMPVHAPLTGEPRTSIALSRSTGQYSHPA